MCSPPQASTSLLYRDGSLRRERTSYALSSFLMYVTREGLCLYCSENVAEVLVVVGDRELMLYSR